MINKIVYLCAEYTVRSQLTCLNFKKLFSIFKCLSKPEILPVNESWNVNLKILDKNTIF